MKAIKVIAVLILALLITSEANAQLVFGKTSRGDLTHVTALTLSAVADTGYGTAIRVPSDKGTVVFLVNLSSVSSSDSLKLELYGSVDGTTYSQISTPSWTQMGSATTQIVTATNVPNYLKVRYYSIGSAVSITGTVKANAKP